MKWLVVIAAVLLFGHDPHAGGQPLTGGVLSLLQVSWGVRDRHSRINSRYRGRELLIPTLVLLFGAEISNSPGASRSLSVCRR